MTSRSVARADRAWRAHTLAVLIAVLVCARARAQSGAVVELAWHAPSGCPSREDVQARIRELAGASQATDTPLRAEATITRNAGGRLHLKLVVRRADLVGERNIEGKSCEDLAGAAAVNLVLLLHSAAPLAAAEPAPNGPAPNSSAPNGPAPNGATSAQQSEQTLAVTPPSPQPSAAESATPPAGEAAHPQRSWRGVLQLPLVSLEFGPLPRPSWGVTLAGGVEVEHWRFLIQASAWLPQTLLLPDHANTGARVERIDAGVRACRAFRLGDLELAPCASVSVQHIWARGTGAYVAARTEQATWLAPGAGAQGRLQLASWFNLLAAAFVHVETSRPVIAIDGIGPVGQLGPVAVTITLGCEWIL
jgi:hypothetical protein